MTDAKTIETRLKEEAKKLLESGAVSVVLGYGPGYNEKHPMPFAASTPEEAENRVFNEFCTANMARYIGRYPAGTKLAVAVKGPDSRAVIVLIQEGARIVRLVPRLVRNNLAKRKRRIGYLNPSTGRFRWLTADWASGDDY